MKLIKFTLVVTALVLAACHSIPLRSPASDNVVNYRFARLPHAADPDLQDALAAFTAEGVTTIDQALAQMSLRHPDFMSRYTLMYDSASVQEGTPEAPRALVFGSDAHFVMSFNGKKGQREYASIETMRFNANKQYEFRTVIFKNEPGAKESLAMLQAGDIDRQLSTKNIVVSKANISRCTICHGDKPRPIWENYPIWPGAYGSSNDGLFDSRTTQGSFEDAFVLKGDDREKLRYQAFMRAKPPRYLNLHKNVASLIEMAGATQRPNLALNNLFAEQFLARVEDQIMSRGLSRAQMQELFYGFVCLPHTFKVSDVPPETRVEILDGYIGTIKRSLKNYGASVDRTALSGVARWTVFTDPKGQTAHFISHSIVRVDDPSWNSPPHSSNETSVPYQFIRSVYPQEDDFVLKAAALVSQDSNNESDRAYLALAKVGINLGDWSLNQMRTPKITNGRGIFAYIPEDLLPRLQAMDPSGDWARFLDQKNCASEDSPNSYE